MAENRYAIEITARSNEAEAAFKRTGDAAGSLGQAVKRSLSGVDNQTKLTVTSIKSMSGVWKNVGADGSRAIGGIGSSLKVLRGDFSSTEAIARNFWASVDRGKDSVEGLTRSAETIRNFGVGLGAAGLGGIALSRHLAQAYKEGAGVEARLESILKQQGRLNDMGTIGDAIGDIAVKGHFADDDELADAAVKMASFGVKTKDMASLLENAARQARTMGTDVSSVAEQLSKAYNTGGVAALAKSGVTVDKSDIEAIQSAYKMSKEMGQQKFMDIIGPAIVNNTVALADSLTATQAAANDAAREMNKFQDAVGKGADNAQTKINGLTAGLIGLVTKKPELAETAGAILTYGSYAATASGGVLGLAGTVGDAVVGFKAYKDILAASKLATDAASASNGIATLATNANTAAIVANGNAAMAAAVKHRALGAAKLLGAAGLGVGLGVGIYELTRGEDDPGAGEAASNAWARLTGGEVTEQDGLTRGQRADNELAALHQKMNANRERKVMASMMSGLQTSPSIPTFGSAIANSVTSSPTGTPAISSVGALISNARKAPSAPDKGQLESLNALAGIMNGSAQLAFNNPPRNQGGANAGGVPTLRPKGHSTFQGYTAQGNLRFKVSFDDVYFEQPRNGDGFMNASA